jgi:hypothetical protein
MEADRIYYRRRLADEMSAAESSSSTVAEACHRRLAALYAQKLKSLGAMSAARQWKVGRAV